ncbi:hypothetical protein L1D15_21560 [Vibrio sp. Isolate25]|uniref:hypothetical protein n=1 Tax=Vibrio sp. Isolate25 TaxID=2908535 RepID=UPI001EFDC422|nr:hypothetical protein [Vibrio sp. Isolate25]MCG9599281.1 hypothetical protein [Vibrio sp. Isolate25]
MDYSLSKDLIGFFNNSESVAIAGSAFLYFFGILIRIIYHWRTNKESSIRLLIENFNAANGNFYLTEQAFVERYRVNIPYRGIQLFLRSNFSSDLLVKYRLGHKYLEFSEDYRKVFLKKTLNALKVKSVLYGLGYAVFGFFGIYMLIITPEAAIESGLNMGAWIVAVSVFNKSSKRTSFKIRITKHLRVIRNVWRFRFAQV